MVSHSPITFPCVVLCIDSAGLPHPLTGLNLDGLAQKIRGKPGMHTL